VGGLIAEALLTANRVFPYGDPAVSIMKLFIVHGRTIFEKIFWH
jgi:hypothetical protein